jgi:FkbM family methyltransferase
MIRKTVFNHNIIYDLPENCGEDFLTKYKKTKLFEGYLISNIPNNSAFLDIGAHNGDTVLTMAIYAKNNNRNDIRFFAFEPDKVKSDFIERTSKLNNLNIKVYCCAIGDKECLVSAQNDKPIHSGATSYKITVDQHKNNIRMTNLNSLYNDLGEVGFLHLDVEGWELNVLNGASKILKNYNPIIIAEYWDKPAAEKRGFSTTAREDIIHHINEYKKYRLYDTLVDGNNNLVFLPNEITVEKKSDDVSFETNEFTPFKKTKTLIGKDNYLFLMNDSCRELEVHCNNINLLSNKILPYLNFHNYMLIVFPNKSLYAKNYLPDNYTCKYRPAFDIYKAKLNDKLLDGYIHLKSIPDAYYKTDTHINLKGSYIIYKEFIKQVNKIYGLNLTYKHITINKKICELTSIPLGIGDLTWPSNLGTQTLMDKNDTFYFSSDIRDFYMKYVITGDEIQFFNYDLVNNTELLIGKVVEWNIISKYIIHKKNTNVIDLKVIIFYDSFLLSTLPLYLELFKEVYMVKHYYDQSIINMIQPDYIFEFRVERFLL